MAIKIKVHLKGHLEKYTTSGERQEYVNIKEKGTLKEVVDYYGFVAGEIGIILINDELVSSYENELKENELKEGDEIKFYPIFAGG